MKTLIGLVVATSFIVACAAPPVSQTVSQGSDIQSEMAALDTQMQALIGDATCRSDAQCQSIGLGNKPCGGFDDYCIYSEHETDVAAVQESTAKYNALSTQWNMENNAISNCMMRLKPALMCHNHHCAIDLNAPMPMHQEALQ